MELSKDDAAPPTVGRPPGPPDIPPPLGQAPVPPNIDQILTKLRNKDWADDLEHLEILGALFGSDEEVDEFVAWIDRRRRAYLEWTP
jgi:hypothetical protein